MPDTTIEKSAEARIAELEQKVEDLAGFVGRLTASLHGASFRKWDPAEDNLLVWEVVPADPADKDDMDIGWWHYDADAVKAIYEASDDA